MLPVARFRKKIPPRDKWLLGGKLSRCCLDPSALSLQNAPLYSSGKFILWIQGELSVHTWTHSGPGRRSFCRFSDPVNLRFDNVASLADVQNAFGNLPSSQYGRWGRPWKPEGDQHVWEGQCGDKNDLHITSGSRFGVRYHVRLWDEITSNNYVIGAAHHEKFFIVGHRVLSFEDAEYQVSEGFKQLPGWTVRSNEIDLRNKTDYPPNDGFLTVIEA